MRLAAFGVADGQLGNRFQSPAAPRAFFRRDSSYILTGALIGSREPSVSVVGAGFGPMLFLRQACAAIVLVMLTLGMQSAGMAGLIEWAKSHFAKGANGI